MLQRSKLLDRFGNQYTLLTPHQTRPHHQIQAKQFTSQLQARRFIEQLKSPVSYWRQVYLESRPGGSVTTNHHRMIDEIALLLYRGTVRIYLLEPQASSRSKPLGYIDSDKTIYAIKPVNHLLTNRPSELKYFADEKAALSFLGETRATDEELSALLREHDLDTVPEARTAAAKALVEETLVVTVSRYTRPPTPDESTGLLALLVDKVAGLGPPPDDEFKEISIDLADEFEGNAGGAYAALFDGVEYTLKTDTGEEHKGVLQGGKINIPKAKMNSGFELSFKDLPAFMEG